MYIPAHFADISNEEIIRFIRQYSFGTIISIQDHKPLATHLPFVLGYGDDGGLKLTSHFARANPQWKDIEGQTVLVIFTEPHAYISPSHYDSALSVPTWNYIAVHAYGTVRLIRDEEAVLASLAGMVDNYEEAYQAQWDGIPADHKSKMMKGIVVFEVLVDRFSAINKLSQNKKNTERKRIIDSLRDSPDGSAREIARFMERNEEKLNQK